jgi:hypothetical protein
MHGRVDEVFSFPEFRVCVKSHDFIGGDLGGVELD